MRTPQSALRSSEVTLQGSIVQRFGIMRPRGDLTLQEELVVEGIHPFINVAGGELAAQCLPFRRADEVALPDPGYLRGMLNSATMLHEESRGREGKAHVADLSLSLSAVLLVDSTDAVDIVEREDPLDAAANLLKIALREYDALSKLQGNPPGYDYTYAMVGTAASLYNYAVAYRTRFKNDEQTIKDLCAQGNAELNLAVAMIPGPYPWSESDWALREAFKKLL